MKRGLWHRTGVLLLALWLGGGLGLSSIQASAMSAKMALPSEMAESATGDCHSCHDDAHGGMDMGPCLLMCGPAAQGLMPGEPLALSSASQTGIQAAGPPLSGQSDRPDHGPPRTPLG